MQAQHQRNGEIAVHKPFRHIDPEDRRHDAIGGAGAHVDILKEGLPEGRQRPGGHDVREHEDRGDELLVLQVGAGDQPGHHTTEKDGDEGRRQRHRQGIEQRLIEGQLAVLVLGGRKDLLEAVQGEAVHRELGGADFLTGVDRDRLQEQEDQRIQRQHAQHDTERDQDDIGRLAEERPHPGALLGREGIEHRFTSAFAGFG